MNSLSELNLIPRQPPLALLMGNFDGVHLGHQKLIQSLKDKTSKSGYQLAIMTFNPHPIKILKPGAHNFLLSSYEERRNRLKNLGIDYLIERTFDRDFSTLSPLDFLKNEVFSYRQLKAIYVGHDFAYGENKSGNIQLIQQLAGPQGIFVEQQPIYEISGERFSSSLIRELLSRGDVKSIQKYLGTPYRLEGLVIKGEGRGRKIGFPTANMQIDEDLMIPTRGVYITKTYLKDMNYISMTNVGLNPTFANLQKLQVETHIFDFSQDIYGEKIWVEFHHKIREEQKFNSVNDLISQLKQDALTSRSFFKP